MKKEKENNDKQEQLKIYIYFFIFRIESSVNWKFSLFPPYMYVYIHICIYGLKYRTVPDTTLRNRIDLFLRSHPPRACRCFRWFIYLFVWFLLKCKCKVNNMKFFCLRLIGTFIFVWFVLNLKTGCGRKGSLRLCFWDRSINIANDGRVRSGSGECCRVFLFFSQTWPAGRAQCPDSSECRTSFKFLHASCYFLWCFQLLNNWKFKKKNL